MSAEMNPIVQEAVIVKDEASSTSAETGVSLEKYFTFKKGKYQYSVMRRKDDHMILGESMCYAYGKNLSKFLTSAQTKAYMLDMKSLGLCEPFCYTVTDTDTLAQDIYICDQLAFLLAKRLCPEMLLRLALAQYPGGADGVREGEKNKVLYEQLTKASQEVINVKDEVARMKEEMTKKNTELEYLTRQNTILRWGPEEVVQIIDEQKADKGEQDENDDGKQLKEENATLKRKLEEKSDANSAFTLKMMELIKEYSDESKPSSKSMMMESVCLAYKEEQDQKKQRLE